MTTDEIRALLEAATPVEGAPGYFVSRCGTVLSMIPWRGHEMRALSVTQDSDGYASVRVAVDGRRRRLAVHRIVAHAFLSPRPSAVHEIRHLNGDRMNPRADNLAWGTRLENAADRERHGRTARGERSGSRRHPERLARGERNGNAVLTDELVRDIRALHAEGWTKRSIARRFGIDETNTGRVVDGKVWTHV